MFSCNLRCRLIFLYGCSRTYRVASLRAGPVGRISYNLYFDCKHVRSVTCDLINEYTFFGGVRVGERCGAELSTGRMDLRVGSSHDFAGIWPVGSGRVSTSDFSVFTDYFLVPKSIWIFGYYIRID